jgi:hypothetical protein
VLKGRKEMMKQFRTLMTVVFCAAGILGTQARASDLVLGAHLGASEYSDLIYGANLTAHPYDMYGLRLDVTFGDGFISSNPGFVFYPVAYEEMSFGIMGGPGITKVDGGDVRFGLNVGALGTVKLGAALEAGLDFRYLFPIRGDAGYMIFANLGFVFNVGDDW